SFRGGFRECAGSPLGRSAALVMAVGLQKFAQKTAPPADPAGGGVKTGLELAGVLLDLHGYKQQVVQECADALGLVLDREVNQLQGLQGIEGEGSQQIEDVVGSEAHAGGTVQVEVGEEIAEGPLLVALELVPVNGSQRGRV